MKIVRFFVVAGLFVGFRPGWAALITFDNLPTSVGSSICTGSIIPNGEGGLNWSNFGYLNADMNLVCSAEGYGTALVSKENVGFNIGGNPASITSSTPFTFESAYFASAWNDGLTVDITAKLGSQVVGSDEFTLDTTSRSFETFNFGPVTELDFSSSGGTENPNLIELGTGGTNFAFDNLTVEFASVPEPGMALELATGLGALALIRRKVWSRRSQ